MKIENVASLKLKAPYLESETDSRLSQTISKKTNDSFILCSPELKNNNRFTLPHINSN